MWHVEHAPCHRFRAPRPIMGPCHGWYRYRASLLSRTEVSREPHSISVWEPSEPMDAPSSLGPSHRTPATPNMTTSERFGPFRSVSDHSQHVTDAGEPLAIFFCLLELFGPFLGNVRHQKLEIRNEESGIRSISEGF